jgi:hypothetical protein
MEEYELSDAERVEDFLEKERWYYWHLDESERYWDRIRASLQRQQAAKPQWTAKDLRAKKVRRARRPKKNKIRYRSKASRKNKSRK